MSPLRVHPPHHRRHHVAFAARCARRALRRDSQRRARAGATRSLDVGVLIPSANGAGRIELVVALTSGGPGAWWAATADGGDVVRLRDLRDERVLTAGAARHVVAGDETAIGLCAAFARW